MRGRSALSLGHSTFYKIPRFHQGQVGWDSFFDSAIFSLEFFVLFAAFADALGFGAGGF